MSLSVLDEQRRDLTKQIQQCDPNSQDYLVRMGSLLEQLKNNENQIKQIQSGPLPSFQNISQTPRKISPTLPPHPFISNPPQQMDQETNGSLSGINSSAPSASSSPQGGISTPITPSAFPPTHPFTSTNLPVGHSHSQPHLPPRDPTTNNHWQNSSQYLSTPASPHSSFAHRPTNGSLLDHQFKSPLNPSNGHTGRPMNQYLSHHSVPSNTPSSFTNQQNNSSKLSFNPQPEVIEILDDDEIETQPDPLPNGEPLRATANAGKYDPDDGFADDEIITSAVVQKPTHVSNNQSSLPTTSPISSFNTSYDEARPITSAPYLEPYNPVAQPLSFTRNQPSPHGPEAKRKYSSLFEQSHSQGLPEDSTVIDLTEDDTPTDKRPRVLMAPNAPHPSPTIYRDIYYKMILPKLSGELKKYAQGTIKFLNDQIERTLNQSRTANQQWELIDQQIRSLKRVANLTYMDNLRLMSLMKSSKMLWVQKAASSKNLEQLKKMADKLYKGGVADYKTYYSQVVEMTRQGEEIFQRAIEHISMSATSAVPLQPPPIQRTESGSLFAPENHRMESMDSFGSYGSEMGGLNREKIEKLLDNIQADIDIKPADRRGTPEELKITLLEHQKLGLTWLQKMEKNVKGGILADDMGLGKTIQTISLMVANKSKDSDLKTTLIVAPVALLKQWEREIITRIKLEFQLSVCIHHGNTRKIKKFSDFAVYDVILTTYGLLSREYKEHFGILDPRASKKSKATYSSPFYQRESVWYRVVLDEAQYIKNKSTLASKACSALESQYRWCLSGTPMQNNVMELYSLLRFLRIKPYDEESLFNKEIGNPIQKTGDKNAMKKLQALLKAILLRRTKSSKIDGKPILQLPPKEVEIDLSVMDEDENEFYHALEEGAKVQMNKYLEQGSVTKNYSNILVLLLRLRQACCHPKLIERAHRLKASKIISARSGRKAIALCRRFSRRVVQKIESQTTFTCPRCMDAVDPGNVVLFFPCGDFICTECCGEFFDSSGNGEEVEIFRCPTCSTTVSNKELIDYSIFDLVHIEGLTDQEIMSNRVSDRRQLFRERSRHSSRLDLTPATRKLSIKEDSDSDFDLFSDDKPVAQTKSSSSPTPENRYKREESYPALDDTQDDALSTEISPGLSCLISNKFEHSPPPDAKPIVEPEIKQSTPSGMNSPINQDPKDGKSNALVPVVSRSNKYFRATSPVSISDELNTNSVSGPAMKSDLAELFPKGWISSSKISKCMEIIAQVHEKFPGEKVIVFSQFTSLLDFLEIALENVNNPNYLRYDGSMNSNSRNQCILDFFDKSELTVLLISLKAGNVGLTLTCASHIVIMDPFWNPFVEEQAMDRAHRIGQMRPVFVHRLVIEGTVEDRILELQRKKKELIMGALDENGMKSIGKLNQKELLFLFGLGSRT